MGNTTCELPERIFIDASYTIGSGKSSGIERVVRNLLNEYRDLGQAGEIPAPRTVISHEGQFFEVDPAQIEAFARTAKIQSNVVETTSQPYRLLAGLICGLTGSTKLRKWLLPQPGHLGLFKLGHSFREHMVRRALAAGQRKVVAQENDLFLLPDAYWINRLRTSVWTAAAEARAQRATVVSLIYDLIPITHPEFVGLKRKEAFTEYLLKAAENSDLLVAISDTVRCQLADFLKNEIGFNGPIAIESFPLGCEFRNVTGEVRSAVQEVFSASQTPYLMVATFDPRKNHKYLLDAFDAMWQQNSDASLCLVGRIGSRCDDIVRRITNHPLLGKRLHLFDNLSDVELQHCYKHARGVIFASVVEGFGLPIVESLWFGKRTFASDTPIHREVGQGDCTFFDLADPNSLVNAINEWEQCLAEDQSPALPSRRPTTWRESSQHLLNHCIQAVNRDAMPSGIGTSQSGRRAA